MESVRQLVTEANISTSVLVKSHYIRCNLRTFGTPEVQRTFQRVKRSTESKAALMSKIVKVCNGEMMLKFATYFRQNTQSENGTDCGSACSKTRLLWAMS